MCTIDILSNETRHLASALRPIMDGIITGHGVIVGKDNITIVYVTYNHKQYGSISPRFNINEKGEVYDPYFHGKQLSVVFDWLNRVGYDKERQISRTETFKRELIAKTLLSGVSDTHAGNDSLG